METLAIGWPQVIYTLLSVLGLGFVIVKHGQPREPYSMWLSIIAMSIAWSLLYWGGFFTN